MVSDKPKEIARRDEQPLQLAVVETPQRLTVDLRWQARTARYTP
jgi:hypothetical protein